jgi:WD domain, G-beta repeat
MALLLGQLIYTSFDVVGFRSLASAGVPTEIQQAFVEKVVHQYWDSYNPPDFGYRAVYLHQITSKSTLFGWLYNDGEDDMGRSNVPYFICYYLSGAMYSGQLETIFLCLQNGPVALIDRRILPESLENLLPPDLWNYQPARAGVMIPGEIRETSFITLGQGKLINLFVPDVENKVLTNTLIQTSHLRSATTEELEKPKNKHRPSTQGIWNSSLLALSLPISNETLGNKSQPLPLARERSGFNIFQTVSVEDYQKMLLAGVKTVFPWNQRRNLMLGTAATLASVMLLSVGGYYSFLRANPFIPDRQEAGKSLANKTLIDKNKFAFSKTLTGHTEGIWAIALSSNGQTLASAGEDKTIKIWNLDTGKVVFNLVGHRGAVRTIALTNDSKTLVSGSGDGTIKIWNLNTFELIRTINVGSGSVWSLAVSPDGQRLLGGSEDGSVKIWNLPTGKLICNIKAHSNRVFSIAISPDGEIFATGGIDKKIKIWNLHSEELIRTISDHQDAVRSVAFSRDGQTLASGSWDNTIDIWQRQTWEKLHTLKGHKSRVVAVTFNPDGNTLTSVSTDKTGKIWNLQTGEILQNLPGHGDWVIAIASTPGKPILASGSRDKTIKIWERGE